MNTMRERRSASGHSESATGGWKTWWTPWIHYRRLLSAKIENAFDPQQVLAAHAAKIGERVETGHPVERLRRTRARSW